jgi:hypothetical protein
MYYVNTSTPEYDITTSYATKDQAQRYGGVALAGENHLLGYDDRKFIDNYDPELEFEDFGRVRTVFRTKRDGAAAGRYMIYSDRMDEDGNEDWVYTGICFQEYGDANKFLKMKSMVCFGDMLVVENPDISQAYAPAGTNYSTDFINPAKFDTVRIKTTGVYDD